MNQTEVELHFSKKEARQYVLGLLRKEENVQQAIAYGVHLLDAWCDVPAKYTTKQTRKNTLKTMNKEKIVENLFVDVMMNIRDQTLANVSTQLGVTLGFQESREGITLAAEIVTVLSKTGFYILKRYSSRGSYYLVPALRLEEEELKIAHRGMYMPPMISYPTQLKHNRDSPYFTVKSDSLILKNYNHHEKNIGIDVINIQNAIPLQLSTEFLKAEKEKPTKTLADVEEKIKELPPHIQQERIIQYQKGWYMHLYQSNYIYNVMHNLGNEFFIPNKVDKRGRVYMQGYHIDPQGTSYKKASVELKRTEKIEVPHDFF